MIVIGQIPCVWYFPLVGMILSNSSAKKKSRRFKATKRSKGNRNGGQGQTLPSPTPTLTPATSLYGGAHPKLDRCSGSGPGSQAGRVEDAVVSGEILPLPPSRLSLAAGHSSGVSSLCGGHRLHSQAVTLARRQNVMHSGTGPGEITSIIKQTNKDLWAYWHCHVYGGGASMLLRSFLWACSKDSGGFPFSNGWGAGAASTVILLEYSAHLSLSEAGTGTTHLLSWSPLVSPFPQQK